MGEPRRPWLLGTPTVAVAVGAALTTVRLPLLGDLGVLLGAVVVVVALVVLRRRLTDAQARRAATVALVAAIASLALRLVPIEVVDLLIWAVLAGAVAGVVAIGVTALAGAREEVARAHPNLAATWRTAVGAVVVCHGPLVVAVVLSVVVDGTVPSVAGAGAAAVTVVVLTPMALLARAGWRSDVAPRRTRAPISRGEEEGAAPVSSSARP